MHIDFLHVFISFRIGELDSDELSVNKIVSKGEYKTGILS